MIPLTRGQDLGIECGRQAQKSSSYLRSRSRGPRQTYFNWSYKRSLRRQISKRGLTEHIPEQFADGSKAQKRQSQVHHHEARPKRRLSSNGWGEHIHRVKRSGHTTGSCPDYGQQSEGHRERPNFFTLKTSTAHKHPRVVGTSGACSIVVGKGEIDKAVAALGLTRVDNSAPRQGGHRFRHYNENHPTLFRVKMPFSLQDVDDGTPNPTGFHAHFDSIEGYPPFLLSHRSLASMGATISLKYMALSLAPGQNNYGLHLDRDGDHLYLPFEPNIATPAMNSFNMTRGGPSLRGGRQYYVSGAVGMSNSKVCEMNGTRDFGARR